MDHGTPTKIASNGVANNVVPLRRPEPEPAKTAAPSWLTPEAASAGVLPLSGRPCSECGQWPCDAHCVYVAESHAEYWRAIEHKALVADIRAAATPQPVSTVPRSRGD